MAGPDRLELLLAPAQDRVTGIDFVYVDASQTQLDVYFLKDPATVNPSLVGDVPAVRFRIDSVSGGESIARVPVTNVQWMTLGARRIARLTTGAPGDFSYYRLRIEDGRIDPFYNNVRFTFKANCPTQFDCRAPEPECRPEAQTDYQPNYTARDFWSYRQALLDFASERYPRWKDRLEADAGMMLVEAISALGDEMAYMQDRIAREGYLETANERRSLRRHARLVDYQVHDGLGASAWLNFSCRAGQAGIIPTGTPIWELGTARGATSAAGRRAGARIVFETGTGLFETLAGYPVDARLNELPAHIWDESAACLDAGATEVYLVGDWSVALPAQPFKWMLIESRPTAPSDPIRRWMIRVIELELTEDPVQGIPLTRIRWEETQAMPFALDLAVTFVCGNLVPATAGETQTLQFSIGTSATAPQQAMERTGPNGSIAYIQSLAGTERRDVDYRGDLVWRGPDVASARPEIRLFEATLAGNAWVEGDEWEWRRSLVGVNSSQASDTHFTLDDGTWRRVTGFQRIGQEIVHRDYATNEGTSVRFGDNEFGRQPADHQVFQARYRLGNGVAGNVTPDTLVDFDGATLNFVASVTNPLAAIDGLDPETPGDIRIRAPEAFRAITYRAVTTDDYAEAAERLDWVQRAGAAFRWTGSWQTCFTTPDPLGSFTVTPAQRTELEAQLNRFRQAGRETHAADPVFVNLDLRIRICVAVGSFRGDVAERVLEGLFGANGFFLPDHFTFGTPLERSALEAAIQRVPGVRAVERIRMRRRGRFGWRTFAQLVYPVAPHELIRVENDREFPERGSVVLQMEGGA
jgi:hypothetical protein